MYQEARPFDSTKVEKPKAQNESGNFLTHMLPGGGGFAGALAGSALGTAIAPGPGTLIGALLGGALGGGLGKVGENAAEGQKDLSSGVLGEAAINGVMGAGPLRLARGGFEAVNALRGGAGLADALASAGTKAATSTIRQGVGNAIAGQADNMVVKNFRFTPGQLADYQKKFGEDVVTTLKKYNLASVSPDEFNDVAIKPLQQAFGSVVDQLPAIPKADVVNALKAVYSPLKNSSVIDKQAIGSALEEQANTILGKFPNSIPAPQVNALRSEFDSLVKYTNRVANPERYDVNKRTADALRGVLQNTADANGVQVNGQSFKQIGTEINKLRTLEEAAARQSQVGRGAPLATLPNLLGSIAGGASGGLPGAIGGAALTGAVNSNVGRRVLTGATEAVGKNVAASGQRAASRAFSPMSIAGREFAGNVIANPGSMLNSGSMPQQQPASPIQGQQMPTGLEDALMQSGGQQGMQGLGSPGANAQGPSMTPDQLVQAIGSDPKNAGTYITLYKTLNAGSTPKALSATQQQQAINASSGLSALQTVQSELQRDPNILIKGAIPTDIGKNLAGAGKLEVARREAADVISRLRTGAAINKEEEHFYRSQLPQLGDSQDVVQYKLSLLNNLFSRFVNPQSSGGLEDALMSSGLGGAAGNSSFGL